MTSPLAATRPATPPERAGMSLLEQLRAATAEQHRELEATVDIARRLRDRDSYRELLEKFYGFYQPLELGIRAAKPPQIGDARIEKARWLAEDLARLGCDVAQLPLCRTLPPLHECPRVLGTMYVIEGSTLGGRHITALLAANGGDDLPRRFFSSYGSEVGPMWRAFCALLDELNSPADHDAAAENARATFECMRAWLSAWR